MQNRTAGKAEVKGSPAEGVHPCPGVGARPAVRPWVWARQAHGGNWGRQVGLPPSCFQMDSCIAFYLRRTGIMEGKLREERHGSDPVDQGPRTPGPET